MLDKTRDKTISSSSSESSANRNLPFTPALVTEQQYPILKKQTQSEYEARVGVWEAEDGESEQDGPVNRGAGRGGES